MIVGIIGLLISDADRMTYATATKISKNFRFYPTRKRIPMSDRQSVTRKAPAGRGVN